MIYHHGGNSRQSLLLKGEAPDASTVLRNEQTQLLATKLLFQHTQAYFKWLRGTETKSKFVYVLGMHRSGTSCLMGSLERCGLYLGRVNRYNKFNEKGMHELEAVVQLNNEILASNGGNWLELPVRVDVSEAQRQVIRELVATFTAHTPCGFKDPRILLMVEAWLEAVESFEIVGTFRHPTAVVQSLIRRNQITKAQGYRLWLHYNQKLVALHKQFQFPLIEYDLSDPDVYAVVAAGIAAGMGLMPNVTAVKEFVSEDLDHSSVTSASVPVECQAVYEYLRQHAYRPDKVNEGFVGLLLACGRLINNEIEPALWDKVQHHGYYLARRYLPRWAKSFGHRVKKLHRTY